MTIKQKIAWLTENVTCQQVLRDAGFDWRGSMAPSPFTGKEGKVSFLNGGQHWTDFSVCDPNTKNGYAGGTVAQLYAQMNGMEFKAAVDKMYDIYHGGADSGTYVPKRYTPAPRKEAADLTPKQLDAAYRIFLDLCDIDNETRQYLEKRGFNAAEIEQWGFKTYPSNSICPTLTRKLKAAGIEPDSVPGLFTKKDAIYCSFHERKALILPVRGVDGLIRGLQCRSFNPNATAKYVWLSSSSIKAGEYEHDGKGSGTPLFFVESSGKVKNSLFITEGIFKAIAFSNTFGCSGFAVQGVSNTAGIGEEVAVLLERNSEIRRVVIAYDADFICNMSVAGEAVKLYKILTQSFPQLRVDYLLWDKKYGKGIDDLIERVGKQVPKFIRAIPMTSFKQAYEEFVMRGLEMSKNGESKEAIEKEFKAVLDKYAPPKN